MDNNCSTRSRAASHGFVRAFASVCLVLLPMIGGSCAVAGDDAAVPPKCESARCNPPVTEQAWPESVAFGMEVVVGTRLQLAIRGQPKRVLQADGTSVYFFSEDRWVSLGTVYVAEFSGNDVGSQANRMVEAVFEGGPVEVEKRFSDHTRFVRSLFQYKRAQEWAKIDRYERGGVIVYRGRGKNALSAVVVNRNAGNVILRIDSSGIPESEFERIVGTIRFRG